MCAPSARFPAESRCGASGRCSPEAQFSSRPIVNPLALGVAGPSRPMQAMSVAAGLLLGVEGSERFVPVVVALVER